MKNQPVFRPELVEVSAPQSDANHAIVVLLCALLMFGPLAYGAVEDWARLLVKLAGAALGLCWLADQLFSPGRRIRLKRALHIPIAVFTVLVCLQLVLGRTAYYERTTVAATGWVSYLVVWLVCSTSVDDSDTSRRVHIVLGAFGFLYAVYALFVHFNAPGQLFWGRMPRAGGLPFGAYVNRNHYAGLMEMLLPLPLVAAMRKDVDAQRRLLFGFCALLMAASVFVAGSRGGMIALLVEAAVALVIFRSSSFARWKAVLAASTFFLLVAWLAGPQVADRIGTLAETQNPQNMRFLITADGVRMFFEKPMLGFGLGTFSDVYPQYRSFFSSEFVNQAHNDYLQLLLETGLIGLLSVLVLVYSSVRSAVAELDIWREDNFSSLSIGAMLGVLGLLAHSFTDFNLQIPANAILFFALCGLAARTRQGLRG